MIDHLVVAGTDLAQLVAWWEERAGAPAVAGGPHPGVGTTNALVGLGPSTYLELIAPDPDQPEPTAPRPFGIDQLAPGEVRLVTWAVSVDDIHDAAQRMADAGVTPGPVRQLGRVRPDGVELSWQVSFPPDSSLAGVVPFLIQWGDGTPHPAGDLPDGCDLVSFSLSHPQRRKLVGAIRSVAGDGIGMEDGHPGLRATIAAPAGQLILD